MNPTICLGSRCSGKTTQLINWCKANNGILLCSSQGLANTFKKMYGIDAEVYSFVSHNLNKNHRPIAIDDGMKFMQWISNGDDLIVSLNTDDAFVYELKEPKYINYKKD